MKIITKVYQTKYLTGNFENIITIVVNHKDKDKVESKTKEIVYYAIGKKGLRSIKPNRLSGEKTRSKHYFASNGKTSRSHKVKGVNILSQTRFSKPKPHLIKPERY